MRPIVGWSRRWGEGDRIPPCLYLKRFGVHAKKVLPQLREVARRIPSWMKKRYQKSFDKAIAEIEASTEAPTLVDLKDFTARPSANSDASTNMKKGKP
jgi:hypothetical protein